MPTKLTRVSFAGSIEPPGERSGTQVTACHSDQGYDLELDDARTTVTIARVTKTHDGRVGRELALVPWQNCKYARVAAAVQPGDEKKVHPRSRAAQDTLGAPSDVA